MNNIRSAAVAGTFYSNDKTQLSLDIENYLAPVQVTIPPPKAIIAPHAGYIYSGPIAASVYASLLPVKDKIKKVILLGPAHRVAFTGIAAPSSDGFATPLGVVPVDQQSIEKITCLSQVSIMDEAHNQEHSLEVHIPFLQTILHHFELTPLLVGDASPEDVSEVLQRLWGKDETLIIISSDLSHFHDYTTAQQMDRSTSTAIEQLQPELIQYDMACGRNPVNGLLALAKQKGLKAQTLDLRNSGDTAGSKDRVVGYGAYAFH